MFSIQYKHYALLLLTVVGVFNYLDRGVLAMSLESIKAEFELSDGQLGLMSGFAFALFYAVAGVPIARWADRGNRNHVITVTAVLWSAMLVLCGLVGNYSQLLLARMGVAVGESGCVPPAQSIISDYFNRAERPRAMSIYWLCAPIATLLSYAGGGWLIENLGWRTTFIIIGFPGLLLAIVVKLTLREPRLMHESQIVLKQSEPSIRDALSKLWRRHALRHTVMAFVVSMFFMIGIAVWTPAFFIRSHGMSAAELGVWIGLSLGLGGLFFTYLGGYLATRYAAQREALQMKSVALVAVCCSGLYLVCFLSGSKTTALILLSIMNGVLLPLVTAPIFSVIQSLTEERMRAMVLALILMFSHLIGMGLGPMAVGLASDALIPMFEQDSLRYSLLFFSPGFLWWAFHAWKASITIEDDIRTVEEKAKSLLTSEADIKPARNYPAADSVSITG